MRTGFGFSVAAHAAILAVGILGLPNAVPHKVEPIEAMPVELVTVADETDLKKGAKEAKELPVEVAQPKPEALAPAPAPKPTEEPAEQPKEAARAPAPRPEPEPEPEAEPPPPEPEQVASLPEPVEPLPEPEPELAPAAPEPETAPLAPAAKPRARPKPPKPVAQPKPEPKAEPAKPKVAETTPEKPTKSFSSDDIAALLDKQKPVGGGDPEPSDQPQTVGSATGTVDAAMTQSWVAALSARLAACWGVPNGVREAQFLRVKIGFNLLPDGSVSGYPTILEVNSSDPLSQVAAEAAQRAVMQCGPYGDIFPVEHYAVWQSIEVIFDPREMFGAG